MLVVSKVSLLRACLTTLVGMLNPSAASWKGLAVLLALAAAAVFLASLLIGSSGEMAPDLIEAAREAVVGYKITYPDVSPEAMGTGYPKFVEAYKKDYGEAPISGYHANAYDGAQLAFKAIEKVAKTDANGVTYIGRKALRDAVLTIKFEGVSGPIGCDKYGECAQFKPAVYEFTNGDPKTFKIGENPKKIWP